MALGPLAMVLPWQNEAEEQQRGRYFGAYLGFVADRNDPSKLGRIRVHIPSMFGPENVADHWTDWAYPMSAGLFVPVLGAPVIVFFEQGFVTHPLYLHGWFTGFDANSSAVPNSGKETDDPTWLREETLSAGGIGVIPIDITLPADTATNNNTRPKYPYNKVLETESGARLEMDDTPEGMARFRYRHPKGLTVLVDTDGSVHFRGGGAYYYNPGGDFVVALKSGSTFKVVYPGGTSILCGATGFHVKGHQASILGRTVVRKETDIG